jgi:metal-responsive CopG/Arc/MetJ family transcriptional regulator
MASKQSQPTATATPPAEPKNVFVNLGLDLLQRVDDYRFKNRVPSRNEAIRQLLEAGLKKSA